MTTSCVVSFAPGSGGHFVGSICQYLLNGIKIVIQPTGSCHGSVEFWGDPDMLLQHQGEAIAHEMMLIQKLKVDPTRVIVTHSRNLFSLREKFDKVVFINFYESDVDIISNKYQKKNFHQPISESSYNKIKDVSWPTYNDFLQGLAPDFIYAEINRRVTKQAYEEWVWIIPGLQKTNNIHKIEFSDIFVNDGLQWIYDLNEFLGAIMRSQQIEYIQESWYKYKKLQ
jgi:hypothetical protein